MSRIGVKVAPSPWGLRQFTTKMLGSLVEPQSQDRRLSGRRRDLGAVVWTSLGPLLGWGPGLTTRWAPGTNRLVLQGTCWCGAQGLQRNSTRLGNYTCPDPCQVLLAVHD
jgi:hypothetical protein